MQQKVNYNGLIITFISLLRGIISIMINVQTEQILIKSKKRVQEHGEVFTPQWVIDKMIAIPEINEKVKDVFATFLEPSAGEGAFLLAIENLKFLCIKENYNMFHCKISQSILTLIGQNQFPKLTSSYIRNMD